METVEELKRRAHNAGQRVSGTGGSDVVTPPRRRPLDASQASVGSHFGTTALPSRGMPLVALPTWPAQALKH